MTHSECDCSECVPRSDFLRTAAESEIVAAITLNADLFTAPRIRVDAPAGKSIEHPEPPPPRYVWIINKGSGNEKAIVTHSAQRAIELFNAEIESVERLWWRVEVDQ